MKQHPQPFISVMLLPWNYKEFSSRHDSLFTFCDFFSLRCVHFRTFLRKPKRFDLQSQMECQNFEAQYLKTAHKTDSSFEATIRHILD